MHGQDKLYRRLQRHLDEQAVGFPATRSGADIRLLKRFFTPEEARVAMHLSYRPTPPDRLIERLQPDFSPEETQRILETMFRKGSVARKERKAASLWYLMPLVVGMYETQLGSLTRRFLADAYAYMKTLAFGKAFLAVKPSQMRTIPINKSIPVDHPVATYDWIRAIVDACEGPFAALPCICRKAKSLQGQPCGQTSRLETCLAFGDTATSCLRRGLGRDVTRDEVLDVLGRNEEDGLVLQPANAQQPEFVCSCCGCCCGMLAVQRMLPHPVDFWSSNYHAEVDSEVCTRCRACVTRCQVRALSLSGPSGTAAVSRSRCIGCGLCVTTCPARALRLHAKETATVPPKDEQALYGEIMANRKGALAQLRMLLKVALRMRQ